MRLILVMLGCYLLVPNADARLGETPIQFVDRYGGPKDNVVSKNLDRLQPLVEGAIHHVYDYQGWKIRAAFLQVNGPAVRLDYQKVGNGPTGIQIRADELEAIRSANTPPGMTWKQIPFNNPNSPNRTAGKAVEAIFYDFMGQKMWQRSDGAILSLRSILIVRVELPAARNFENALKVQKEEKARMSIPNF